MVMVRHGHGAVASWCGSVMVSLESWTSGDCSTRYLNSHSFNIGTPVAWHYWVSDRTGFTGVSMLSLGNFCLIVAARTFVEAAASLDTLCMLLAY